MQIGEMLSAVNRWLNSPRAQYPTRQQRLDAVTSATQSLVNKSNNTPVSRVMGSVIVKVPAFKDVAEVSAENFGQALYIHTLPADPNWEQEEIPIVLPQNLDRVYDGPHQAIVEEEHQAVVFALYQDGPAVKLIVRPVHTINANYLLWYKTGTFDAALGSEPPLAQFHDLIVFKACLSLLSKCEWAGIPEQRRAQQVTDLRAELELNLVDYKDDLDHFIETNHQAQAVSRIAFGEEYDE